MIKACIFDLDGTLVNSLTDLQNAVNTVLQKHQYPTVTQAQMKQMVGNGIRKLVERALPNGSDVDRCLEEFTIEYRLHCVDYTRPYPGIQELLRALKQKGFQLAVISNKADPLVKQIVGTLFPAQQFDFVAGMKEGIAPKPDPSALLAVCKAFGLSPESCVMIGDSNVDMMTARNAKMLGFGVTWGFRSREELAQNGATALFDTAEQLQSALLK